jgi:hypothetical protein
LKNAVFVAIVSSFCWWFGHEEKHFSFLIEVYQDCLLIPIVAH